MPLEPASEDVRKLHAEVNQIVNQRFVLTTLAITIFGVIISVFVPKTTPAGPDVGPLIYLGSILLIIILWMLFIYDLFLKNMMRVYTTYLEVAGLSEWEKDWKIYRQNHVMYFGYSNAQATVFLFLGLLSGCFPLLISLGFSLTADLPLLTLNTVIVACYGVFVALVGWGRVLYPEEMLRKRWNEQKKAKDIPPAPSV